MCFLREFPRSRGPFEGFNNTWSCRGYLRVYREVSGLGFPKLARTRFGNYLGAPPFM